MHIFKSLAEKQWDVATAFSSQLQEKLTAQMDCLHLLAYIYFCSQRLLFFSECELVEWLKWISATLTKLKFESEHWYFLFLHFGVTKKLKRKQKFRVSQLFCISVISSLFWTTEVGHVDLLPYQRSHSIFTHNWKWKYVKNCLKTIKTLIFAF